MSIPVIDPGNATMAMLREMPFIYVENVSFTMINCLYTGNDIRNHMVLNATDVTIKNVTFFNNSFGGNDEPKYQYSLLKVSSRVMEIDECNFQSNNIRYGSLMLVFWSNVTMRNSVMMDNYVEDYMTQIVISVHDSNAIEFSNSKFLNNSHIDMFDVFSSSYLLIVNCSFEINDGFQFNIWNTYDVILQRSTFFVIGSVYEINSLRIFECTSTFKGDSFLSDRNVRTRVFRLDSNVSLDDVHTDKTMLIEGSPYASGGCSEFF